MHKVKIYKAKKSDYQSLINLWENSVTATHHFLSPKDIKQYKLLIHDYYFDNMRIYYLRDQEKMIGFIGLDKQFIRMLFVDPDKFDSGVGTTLINFAIKKHQAKTVDVNEQNTSAMGFYLKMGFKAIGRSSVDAVGKPFPVISLELVG